MARLKQVQKQKEVVGEALVARSREEMLRLAMEKQLSAESLTEKEVGVLVDALTTEDKLVKVMSKEVTTGKEVLLDYAKYHEIREFFGEESLAEVRDSSSFELPASKVIKILEKEGKLKLLDSLLKVSITEFRKYLGSDLFESSAKKEVKPYASISLKRKKE